MKLLDELKSREAELVEKLNPIRKEYDRLTIEFRMVNHGLLLLFPKPRISRAMPDSLLNEAEEMRSRRVKWHDVAEKLGVPRNALQKAVERKRDGNSHRKRRIADPPPDHELKVKEAELIEKLNPIREEYDRLTIELKMVQHGLALLLPKPRKSLALPDSLLDEAEKLRSQRATWEDVAKKLGVPRHAVQKAVERRQNGNPHRKHSIASLPLHDSSAGKLVRRQQQ